MEWTSTDVIGVITYLLPGFLAAWVFFGLTAHPRKEPFERVVQALIFTAIVQGLTAIVRWALLHARTIYTFGEWSKDVALVWSLINAALVGLVFALFANKDWFHHVFRKLKITKRTSFPSEWFSAFNRAKRRVTLHLEGGRRLYGWPFEWPDQADIGHFVIEEPAWILDNNECAPLHLVKHLLIPATAVEMVELMKEPEEIQATDEQIRATESQLLETQKPGEDDHGKQSPTASAEQRPAMRTIEHERASGKTAVRRVEAGNNVTPAPAKEKLNGNHGNRNRKRK